MKPIYHITCNSTDITSQLQDRMASITITDEAGFESDKLSITVADPNADLAMPVKGAEITVALGFKNTGLVPFGKYTLDNIKLSGVPDKLTINANAADFSKGLKEQKTRSFEHLTFKQLLKTIAIDNNLSPKIDDNLAVYTFHYIAQTEESDIHLLRRIAENFNAIVKPVEHYLVITSQGNGKNIKNITMPTITINRDQVSSYSIDLTERSNYKSVIASYRDNAQAKTNKVRAGQGLPVYTIRNIYADIDEARKSAEKRLEKFSCNTATINISIPGNPQLRAETNLKLIGFRHGINGNWVVKKATHKLSQKYTTTIEATQK